MESKDAAPSFEGDVRVDGEATKGCQAKWKDDVWDVLDCSFDVVRELEDFLSFSPKKMKRLSASAV
jgi:hypothetical protein